MGMFLNSIEPYDKYKTITKGLYFVDKTELLEELIPALEQEQRFFCITRPRRFGKTGMANMIASFFEKSEGGSDIFDRLKISEYPKYKEHLNKHDVVYIDFSEMPRGCRNYQEYILRIQDGLIRDIEEAYPELEIKSDAAVWDILSHVFDKTGDKFVFVMDEWDAVFHKSFITEQDRENFLLFLKLLLKGKSYVELAYMTGVLPIAKYSDGSELNMFLEYNMATRVRFSEYFGFSDEEVDKLYEKYLQNTKKPQIDREGLREWYDGYHFGECDVYCPWDVIQYCKSLYLDVSAKPQDFWSNSSGNAIVRRFIDKADISTRNEIERLIAGESIEKDVVSELTYDEIDKSIENLWSVLFTTGYLTHKGCTESGKYRLVIPNKEVRNLFVKKIREWFSDVSRNDGKTLEEFCSAFVDKDSEKIEQIFGDYLWNTISIRDTAVAKEKKENFYHGILLGLLGYKSNWLIKSNAESGIGYSDILVEVPTNRTGIVIEIKYAEDGDLDAACEKALKQIEEKDYVAKLKQDGMKNFIKYGVACFKKICKVEIE